MVPAALETFLSIERLRRAWDELTPSDREKYATWVAKATSEKSARRRALVVADRLRDGRGWARAPRRIFEHHFAVPKGGSAADARAADIRSDSSFGHSPFE